MNGYSFSFIYFSLHCASWNLPKEEHCCHTSKRIELDCRYSMFRIKITVFCNMSPCNLTYRSLRNICVYLPNYLQRITSRKTVIFVRIVPRISNHTHFEILRWMSDDHSGRAVWGINCLRSLEHWDRGIESHSRYVYVCLYSVCVVLRVGSGLTTGWSPVQGVLPSVLFFA
jgi:hypothetical protein